MIILDGKKLSTEIASSLREAISLLEKKPKLLIVLIGEDVASQMYVNRKKKFAEEIGVDVQIEKFEIGVGESEVLSIINEANKKQEVHGIMVQLPIPGNLNQKKITDAIIAKKDVDGLGRGKDKFLSATTRGVMTLLEENNIAVAGKKVVIINDSDLIGKPTAEQMQKMGAEVVVCNEGTENIKEISKSADLLVTAIGQPEIIDDSYLSDGQVVVDVGISKAEKGIVGDLKTSVGTELKALTPVPGGVGPMTVASLFQNVLDAYEMQQK